MMDQHSSIPRTRPNQMVRAFTLCAALCATLSPEPMRAQTPAPDAAAFSVRVVGKGRPMLLIPGLTSGGAVWDGTVKALESRYQLHVFTLAGFAGQPAVAVDSTWLPRMRDSIVAYTKRAKLDRPVIMGHSLGGFLALSIAISHPSLPSAIVNVDGLPFLGATQDTNATPATTRGQADAMRKMMSGGNQAGFARMQDMQLKTMIRDTSFLPLASSMGRTSDLRTAAEAMHALFTTDLRPELHAVKVPVLNLHAWAAYKNFGMTRERIEAMLASQYRGLATGTTRIHDGSYHFIMFDEPAWMLGEVQNFLSAVPSR